MSFVAQFNARPLAGLVERSGCATVAAARESLGRSTLSLADFANLLSPAGAELISRLAAVHRL